MKTLLAVLLCALSIFCKLYSQEDDFIIATGAKDDWSNTDRYLDVIKNELRKKLLLELDSTQYPINGRIIIDFTISETGNIENVKIKKSLREDVDSVLINVITSFKFDDAPLYSSKGEPHAINFTLPVKFDFPTKEKK